MHPEPPSLVTNTSNFFLGTAHNRRAYTIPGDGPADIEVLYHSAGQLHSEEVQVKMRRNPEDLRIAMSHPKYARP